MSRKHRKQDPWLGHWHACGTKDGELELMVLDLDWEGDRRFAWESGPMRWHVPDACVCCGSSHADRVFVVKIEYSGYRPVNHLVAVAYNLRWCAECRDDIARATAIAYAGRKRTPRPGKFMAMDDTALYAKAKSIEASYGRLFFSLLEWLGLRTFLIPEFTRKGSVFPQVRSYRPEITAHPTWGRAFTELNRDGPKTAHGSLRWFSGRVSET